MKISKAQTSLNEQFLEACRSGDLATVKRLLTHPKKRADISYENNRGITNACEHNHLSIVQYLLTSQTLTQHADIHTDSDYPLRIACMKGHMEVVKYLLTTPEIIQAGGTYANLHANNDEALINACTFNHLSLVQYLLTSPDLKESGHTYPDIHAQWDLPIRAACHYGDVHLVKYLLTSPELAKNGINFPRIHTGNDEAFIGACEQNVKYGQEIIEYLIIDYGIPMTSTIESFLSLPNDNHISNGDILVLFKRGELEKSLQGKLEPKTTNGKKNKI